MKTSIEIERLFIEYDYFLWSFVKRYRVSSFDQDDLYQAARLGFLKAINNYDEDQNVKLTTFAFKYVLGEVNKEYYKICCSYNPILQKIRIFISENPHISLNEIKQMFNISHETLFIAINEADVVSYLTDDIRDSVMEKRRYNLMELNDEELEMWNDYNRYYYSQEELAKKYNCSQSTISRKIKKIVNKII